MRRVFLTEGIGWLDTWCAEVWQSKSEHQCNKSTLYRTRLGRWVLVTPTQNVVISPPEARDWFAENRYSFESADLGGRSPAIPQLPTGEL